MNQEGQRSIKAITANGFVLFCYVFSTFMQMSWVKYACICYYFVCFVIMLKSKEPIRAFQSYYVVWIWLLTVYSIASSLWSNDILRVLNATKGMIEYSVVGTFLFYSYLKDENKKRTALFFIEVSGVCLALYLLFQAYRSGFSGRLAYGLFAANSNAVKLLEVVAIALLFLCTTKYKIRNISVIVLMIIAILMTGSRTMMAGTAVAVVAFLIMNRSRRNYIKPVLIILITYFVVQYLYRLVLSNPTLYSMIGYRTELLINQLLYGGRTYSSDASRYVLIEKGLELFRERPIFGWGGFMYQVESGTGVYYSHNNYVELLADFGIFGTVLYYSFFVVYLIKAMRLLGTKANPIICFCISLIISFLLIDIGTVNWYRDYTHILFPVLAASIEYEKRKENIKNELGGNVL